MLRPKHQKEYDEETSRKELRHFALKKVSESLDKAIIHLNEPKESDDDAADP